MLFIGLMSGTSTDGVDAVLCRISAPDALQMLAEVSLPLPASLQKEILALNTSSDDELARAALAANALGRLYAQACNALFKNTQWCPADVTAIGVHGQTVRHAPDQGYTIQLNAPALLAELTGIDVIADFRSRDIAAGGQGAPLVPIFHQALFGNVPEPRLILNLGGIANISYLQPEKAPLGFDTGPANMLMDAWIQQHQGLPYDADGAWAASGTVLPELLQRLLSEPWLQLPPPKSTGRDLFNNAWLQQHLRTTYAPADVQATLAAFTVETIAQAIAQYTAAATEIIVCGGGAYNSHLINSLAARTKKPLRRSDELGLGAQQVEAAAFAWLAYAYWHDIPAGQPGITGAKHPTLLGAWYKA